MPAGVGEDDSEDETEEEDTTENALLAFSRFITNDRWVTTKDDQRVYIGDDGGFRPHGPGSDPVTTKKSSSEGQKQLTGPHEGTTIGSSGGDKTQTKEPKMNDSVMHILKGMTSVRAGGAISEDSLKSLASQVGMDMEAAVQQLEESGLIKPDHLGNFRYWKPTKAGMQKVSEEDATRDARKLDVMQWNPRKKTFDRIREDPEAIEQWRKSPNRIHVVEDARFQHDTSGLDYDRPVRTQVLSKPIGTLLPEGVVADKRIINGKTEYLLKSHTKATRAQFEQQEKKRELAHLEKLARTDVDMRPSEQQADLNRRIAELRRGLQ